MRHSVNHMNQEQFTIFDELIDGVQVLDSHLDFCYLNAAVRQQLSLGVEVMSGYNFQSLCDNRKWTTLLRLAETCLKQKTECNTELTLHPIGDKPIHLIFRLQPMLAGLLITSAVNNAFRSPDWRENVYQMLFEKMQESFILVKAVRSKDGTVVDLRIEALNDVAAKSFKQPAAEVVGKLRSETLLGPPDESTLQLYDRIFNHGDSLNFEYKFPGTEKYYRINHFQPDPEYLATLATDVTDLKVANGQLEKINEQLEHLVNERTAALQAALDREMVSNTMKSTFLSMTSHELHTPLASIQLSLEILERRNNGKHQGERRRYHQHIKEETDNLMMMLRRMGEDNPLMNRDNFLVKESIKPVQVLEEIVHEMSLLTCEAQSIRFHFQGENSLTTDRGILRRILINLLSNAIKYSTRDVHLRVRLDDGELNIMVRDEGIGIPTEDQAGIFTRNFRAGNTTGFSGSGLGLSIVSNYVKLLGGEVEFESTEGKGSTFWVTLPVGASNPLDTGENHT